MDDICIAYFIFSTAANISLFYLALKQNNLPYLLDQTPLSISRRSRIVAAPPDVLNEIVAALEY